MEINVENFKKCYKSGFVNLHNYYVQINKLNVFPVPDGDTGTNMHLTTKEGMHHLNKTKETASIREAAENFSRGLVMGARGNSGVILSQIFRGFANGIEKDKNKLTTLNLINCLELAKDQAYKAVMTPVEGTILTVIREISENMQKHVEEIHEWDWKKVFKKIVEYGNISLNNTPNLLPILKEVGVVDSGGFGLMKFIEGILYYFENNKIITSNVLNSDDNKGILALQQQNKEYGYCTEAAVTFSKENQSKISIANIRQTLLDQKGQSIVAILDREVLKVHVHTLHPGIVLTFLQQYGEFNNVKVDNMTLQSKGHSGSFMSKRKLINKYTFIMTVSSQETADYFLKELDIEHCIIASKFMNPSVETFLDAIKSADANVVYVFPNNKNSILAAEHAAKLENMSQVHVLPTRYIAEGMAAVISYDPSQTTRRNITKMKKTISNAKTIAFSKSDKETDIHNIKIKPNDYFAISNGKVTNVHNDLKVLLEKSIAKTVNKTMEVITLFYNGNIDSNYISWLKKYLDENYDLEYEFINLGESVYQFVISIE